MSSHRRADDLTLRNTVTSVDLELLVTLFDQASDVAFFVKNATGHYVAVNDSLLKRHGLKQKSDAIGKRPSEICPGDFGRVPTDQDDKVLRSRQPIVNHLEMQWHRPYEPVWCLTTKLPILDANSQVCGLIGFSRDVRLQVESPDIPEQFATALDYFELNLHELVSPRDLAVRSNLTTQRLNRLTKRVFGLTAGQLITKTRIAAASRLLLETEKSISDISLACGFFDQSAFTRAFHSATGVTPSQFRKHSAADA
ncbi:MAG: AraC family transcriptional regulator [Pirellulaceae bacterium]|nr:AraC family transcriptional regulator [Pirellulaceae bacterium]